MDINSFLRTLKISQVKKDLIRAEFSRYEKYLNLEDELAAAPEDVASRAQYYESWRSRLLNSRDRENDPLGINPDISPRYFQRGQETFDYSPPKTKNYYVNVKNFNRKSLRHVGQKYQSPRSPRSPRSSPRSQKKSPLRRFLKGKSNGGKSNGGKSSGKSNGGKTGMPP
jgi:hypothetical protein